MSVGASFTLNVYLKAVSIGQSTLCQAEVLVQYWQMSFGFMVVRDITFSSYLTKFSAMLPTYNRVVSREWGFFVH